MDVRILDAKQEMGLVGAADGAAAIHAALDERSAANIILATGASQFPVLDGLIREDLDFSRIHCFHLDEYVGIPVTHPASFRKYLRERFVDRLPVPPAAFHFLDVRGRVVSLLFHVLGDQPRVVRILHQFGCLTASGELNVAWGSFV